MRAWIWEVSCLQPWGLRCESCSKTLSSDPVGTVIEAAGWKTRRVSRLGVACIKMLLALLREVDVMKCGTGLGDSFIDSLLKSFA